MVAIALRIGAAAWRREQLGAPLAILVLDEIEGKLDERNAAAVADIVHRISPGLGFAQTFWVSHRASQARGSRVIEIDRSNGWSTLQVR